MDTELIAYLNRLLTGIEFGKISIIIQNGRVLDVIKEERIRLHT